MFIYVYKILFLVQRELRLERSPITKNTKKRKRIQFTEKLVNFFIHKISSDLNIYVSYAIHDFQLRLFFNFNIFTFLAEYSLLKMFF